VVENLRSEKLLKLKIMED